jgi:hypothetical protein
MPARVPSAPCAYLRQGGGHLHWKAHMGTVEDKENTLAGTADKVENMVGGMVEDKIGGTGSIEDIGEVSAGDMVGHKIFVAGIGLEVVSQ